MSREDQSVTRLQSVMWVCLWYIHCSHSTVMVHTHTCILLCVQVSELVCLFVSLKHMNKKPELLRLLINSGTQKIRHAHTHTHTHTHACMHARAHTHTQTRCSHVQWMYIHTYSYSKAGWSCTGSHTSRQSHTSVARLHVHV